MEAEATLPAEESEDEEFGEMVFYGTMMHEALATIVKKFLVD